MARTGKILGQVNPAAGDPDTNREVIYTVPPGTTAIVSAITACDTGGAASTVGVAFRSKGEVLATKHWIYYDKALTANATLIMAAGLPLEEGDIVEVYSSVGDTAFGLFGVESTFR